MDESAIAELEGKVLSNINGTDTSEETTNLISEFSKNPENVNYFKTLYENDEKNDSLHFWAANKLADIVKMYGGQWSSDQNREIALWAIEVSRAKLNTRTNPCIRQAAKIVSNVMKGAGINRRDLILQIMQNIFSFFDQDPPAFYVGLNIIATILSELDDAEKNVKESFSIEFLENIFSSAFSLIDSVDEIKATDEALGDSVLKHALEVCKRCLSFDMGRKPTQQKGQKLDTITLTSNMNDFVGNCEVIGKFINIYLATSEPDAMNAAINICSLSSNNIKQDQKNPVISKIFEIIIEYISEKSLENLEVLKFFSEMLNAISGKIDTNGINQIETFRPLFDAYTSAIIDAFNSKSFGIRTSDLFMGSLRFFMKVFQVSSRSPALAEAREYLSGLLCHVCQSYIEFLVGCAEGAGKEETDLLWPNLHGISQLVSPIEVLILTNPPEIVDAIIRPANEMMGVISAPQKPDDSVLISISKQLGTLLMIITAALKNQCIDPTDTSPANFNLLLFDEAVRILNESGSWINGGARFIELEKSVVAFIFGVYDTDFLKLTARRAKLYQSLNQISSPVTSPEVAADLIAQRLVLTLKSFVDSDLIESAVASLCKAIEPSMTTTVSIVEDPTMESFPFMADLESNRKNRMNFYSQLMQSLFEVHKDGVEQLLTVVTNETKGTQSPESVLGLCEDVRGMFLAAKESEKYSVLFDWFFPDIANFFVAAANGYMSIPTLIKQILKLFCAVVENRPSKRIVFPPSSAGGNELFEKCAELLNAVLDNVAQQDPSQEDVKVNALDLLKYSCKMFEFLLNGDYVCFDAFKIYEISTFNDILEKITTVMMQFDCSPYPKHVTTYAGFIKALCSKQFEALLGANAGFVEYIIDFCINIYIDGRNQDAKGCIDMPLENIARYIVDDTYENQSVSELFTENAVKFHKLILVIWNAIFNNESVSRIEKSLKLFLIVAPEIVDQVFGTVAEMIPEEKKPQFESVCTNFKNDLEACLDGNDQTFFSKCISLQKFVKESGANISIPIEQDEPSE